MLDLHFIAGNFLYGDIPETKAYLAKYFSRSVLDRKFLSYYFLFGDLHYKRSFGIFYNNFVDHTGCVCSARWIWYLVRRVKVLEGALKRAYDRKDLEEIVKIKNGKFFRKKGGRKN